MLIPALAHLTTCLASASWSISSSPALKGVVSGTPGPFLHLGRETPLEEEPLMAMVVYTAVSGMVVDEVGLSGIWQDNV